jgi:Ca-activated chloride channel family protein
VHVGNFTYDDILTLAKSTRGEDDFGYRTEFMQLVRTAKSLAGETGGLDKPIE